MHIWEAPATCPCSDIAVCVFVESKPDTQIRTKCLLATNSIFSLHKNWAKHTHEPEVSLSRTPLKKTDSSELMSFYSENMYDCLDACVPVCAHLYV